MGRKNQNAFIKKQKAEIKRKKREAKLKKREARKELSTSGELEDMIAYVDKDGNITSEPPEEKEIKKPSEDKKKNE